MHLHLVTYQNMAYDKASVRTDTVKTKLLDNKIKALLYGE